MLTVVQPNEWKKQSKKQTASRVSNISCFLKMERIYVVDTNFPNYAFAFIRRFETQALAPSFQESSNFPFFFAFAAFTLFTTYRTA